MQSELTFLVIDNNPNERLLVTRELKREFPDFKVKEIIDAKGFSQAMKANDFDFVLTDYNLNWTNGIKILQEIRAQLPNCPVIMFTSYDREEIAVEALKEGMDDYIIKSPQHIKQLPIKVKSVLERFNQHQAMIEAENALKESEESYRTLFEESRDAIYVITRDGKFEDVNQSMLDLLGYTKEEILKLDVLNLYVHPDDRLKFQKEIEEKGSVRDFGVQFRKKDGTEIDCLLTSSIRRRKGEILGYQGIIRDITEKKRMGKQIKQYTQNLELMVEERTIELRESEELLKAILAGIGDFITIQNKDLDIIWVNEAIKKTWGNVIGKKCYEVYKCSTIPCSDCHVGPVLQAGKTIVSERVNILPNRQQLHVLITSSPMRNADGNIAAVVELEKDITKLKQTEDALRESEYTYRTLVEHLPQRIFIKDRNSVYLSCNDNYANDFNIKPNEITGKTDYDFFPQELAEKYRKDDKRVMESGKTEELEEDYIIPGGDLRIVHTVKTPFKDENSNIIGVLGIFWDITERKHAQEALKESEERYHGLYDSSIDGIASADLEGNILECNQAYADMLGYTKEELYKKSLLELVPQESLDIDDTVHIKQVIKNGYSDEFEGKHIKKDGTIIPVSVRLWLIKDSESKPIGMWGIARDITERKKLDQMKADFINLAAHELRTPLSAMKAHVELLKIKSERGYWNLPEEVHEKIKIIVRNTDRLAVLISNLLDYTRLEAGTVKLKQDLVSIEAEISDIITELLPLAQKHEHMINFNVPKSLPLLNIDKEKFHSILRNVLSNAIKYTPDGGKINITVFEENNSFHIEVEDNGVGIKQEDLEKIFQPFQIAEIPPSMAFQSEFERTGLGLAITKQYLDMLDGKIWAESQIGKGSTFHILLPKKQNEIE
jgi:PAS domain S-box-containing protein